MTADYATECLTPQQRNPSLPTTTRIPHVEPRPMTPLNSHLISAAGSLRFAVRQCETGDLSLKAQRELLLQVCRDVAGHLDGEAA